MGGVARRATLIKQEREKDGALLVVDAGDGLVGDQDPAKTTKGASSIEALNRMSYDVVTLGPADLSLGAELLRQRIGEAKFPIVSADVALAAEGSLFTKPYTILEKAGRRIGVIGLSGGPAPAEFKLLDGVEAARQAAAELSGKVDAILLLTHAPPDVNRRIAGEVPGITAIVEGGADVEMAPLTNSVTGTPLYHADQASSGHAGRVAGIATLRAQGGRLLEQSWQRVELQPYIADDADLAAWVASVTTPQQPVFARPAGSN